MKRQHQSARNRRSDAGHFEAQGFGEHEPHNIRGLRPHSHAHADLVGVLAARTIVVTRYAISVDSVPSRSTSLAIRSSVRPLSHRNQKHNQAFPSVPERYDRRAGQICSPCCRLGL